MVRINIREILVLIFISIFVAIALPIIRIFFSTNFLGWYIIFIIPFLFGVCSAYIMHKGEKNNFIKKSMTQGLIISVFIFIFTFYFSETFFSYARSFLDYMNIDSKLADLCLVSSEPRCKLLEMLLLSSKIESNKLHLSMLSLLGYFSGILIYSIVIQRFIYK